jgi:hypothetical protein
MEGILLIAIANENVRRAILEGITASPEICRQRVDRTMRRTSSGHANGAHRRDRKEEEENGYKTNKANAERT